MIKQICHLEHSEAVSLYNEILAVMMIAYRPIHLTELLSITNLLDQLLDNLKSLKELVELCSLFLIV
jgi:hypothetical protein